MFRRPIKEINAEFSAEEKYLDSIQRTTRESCIAAGLSRKNINAVLLAIEEGATNIIRHAYLYEKGILRLRIVIYKRMMVISLIDFGRSFQPDENARLDINRLVESGRKGGLGFYMIQKIMDSVEYISSASVNELRMIKKIKGERVGDRTFIRRLSTLRVKFSFWTLFIMLIILGGSFYNIDRRTRQQAINDLDVTITSLTKTIADQSSGYHINRRSDVEYDELVVSYMRANPELRLLVITDSLNLTKAHSHDIHLIGREYFRPPGLEITRDGVALRYEVNGEPLNYLVMPIMTGDYRIGSVNASYSSEHLQGILVQTRNEVILFTLLLLLFGIFGIYLLSNYFVNPIVKITRRVRRFTTGDLESELPLEGAEEFFEISRAFNEMMTRVSQDKKNIAAREKLAKEIEVASQIQKTLLPRQVPSMHGLEVETYYQAASVIGGDLYDLFEIAEDRYCLVVADVSGKGVPASLVMSMARTVVQIHAAGEVSSKKILVKVNDYLSHNIPPGMFITMMMIIYDTRNKRMNFVSAGHNPMIFYRASERSVITINPAGMPLGVPITDGSTFESKLEEGELSINDGDLFFIYTDGITEAINREKKQYGVEPVMDLIKGWAGSNSEKPLKDFSDQLVASIGDFTGFASASDDITFIAARIGTETAKDKQVDREKADSDVEIRRLDNSSREF